MTAQTTTASGSASTWTLNSLQPPWTTRASSVYSSLLEGVEDPRGVGNRNLDTTKELASLNIGFDLDRVCERRIADCLRVLLQDARPAHLVELYTLLTSAPASSFFPATRRAARTFQPLDKVRARELAIYIATKSPDLAAVLFSLALFCLVGRASDVDIVHILSARPDTLSWCVRALESISTTRDADMFRMAKTVNSTRRVEVLTHLRDTNRDDIKTWMLQEAVVPFDLTRRRELPDSSAALICATSGQLLTALERQSTDHHMLDCAANLLYAMVSGFFRPTLGDYPDAPRVLQKFMRQVSLLGSYDLRYCVAIHRVRCAIECPRFQCHSWKSGDREALAPDLLKFLRLRPWVKAARLGLTSTDAEVFRLADVAWEAIGRDPWPIHERRLRHTPCDKYSWRRISDLVTPSTIVRYLKIAERSLPILDIDRFRTEDSRDALCCVVTTLRTCPTAGGWKYVRLALRHRECGCRTLAIWSLWSLVGLVNGDELAREVEVALERENDPQNRDNLELFLKTPNHTV